MDRAIRIHQNLLARPNLSEAQRHQALFSLAKDFLGAGLFDRAEKLFSELSSSPTMGQAALDNLVDIYERERNWSKAIETRRKLEILTGEKSTEVAHYYCELAERARVDGRYGVGAAAPEEIREKRLRCSPQYTESAPRWLRRRRTSIGTPPLRATHGGGPSFDGGSSAATRRCLSGDGAR